MILPLQFLFLLLSLNLTAAPVLKTDELVYRPVQFTVVDEQGVPVQDARVIASDPAPGNLSGTTNSAGRLSLRLAVQLSLTIEVSREGFYTSRGEIWQGGLEKLDTGKYRPREMPDSFEVVLRPVRDPQDLVYRMYRGRAPRSEEPLGFDLLLGDWTQPHGVGKTTDLLFHFHDTSVQPLAFTGTMTLSFPNPGDGIQPFTAAKPLSIQYGSALAPPHKAPIEGYRSSLSYTLSHQQGEPWSDYKEPNRNYIFRSRTLMDEEGRIRRACYGWILGEIEFDPRDPNGPQLSFTYHFNPDPSPNQRSLESTMYLP